MGGSGHAMYVNAHDPKYGKPHPVPMVTANETSLKGYGTIVTSYDDTEVEITTWPQPGWRPICPGTGNQGGVTGGEFTYIWEGDLCLATNKAVPDGDYVIGRLPANVSRDKRTHVLVREANYHPDGGQVFYPSDGSPFVALLALPGDNIGLDDFRAFYFDGTFGVQIHANIWHQPIYPINDSAVFLGKQGKVHACIAVDTVDEFGKYLLVPLTCDV